MSMQQDRRGGGLDVDLDALYREEVFTDGRGALVRRLNPVRRDGSPDPGRPALYLAETTLNSNLGPIPVSVPVEADSLEAAFREFPSAIRKAVDDLDQRMRELARDEASRIVVPTAVPTDLAGGGDPRGGAGGGILLR